MRSIITVSAALLAVTASVAQADQQLCMDLAARYSQAPKSLKIGELDELKTCINAIQRELISSLGDASTPKGQVIIAADIALKLWLLDPEAQRYRERCCEHQTPPLRPTDFTDKNQRDKECAQRIHGGMRHIEMYKMTGEYPPQLRCGDRLTSVFKKGAGHGH